MSRRWPLHPPPFPDEALSSWLNRLAHQLMDSPERLLAHEFGIRLGHNVLYRLDFDPPQSLVTALAEKTGRTTSDIVGLTARGYVPHIFDTLEEREHGLYDYTKQLWYLRPLIRRETWAKRLLPWYALSRFRTPPMCRACLLEPPELYLRLYCRANALNST